MIYIISIQAYFTVTGTESPHRNACCRLGITKPKLFTNRIREKIRRIQTPCLVGATLMVVIYQEGLDGFSFLSD